MTRIRYCCSCFRRRGWRIYWIYLLSFYFIFFVCLFGSCFIVLSLVFDKIPHRFVRWLLLVMWWWQRESQAWYRCTPCREEPLNASSTSASAPTRLPWTAPPPECPSLTLRVRFYFSTRSLLLLFWLVLFRVSNSVDIKQAAATKMRGKCMSQDTII